MTKQVALLDICTSDYFSGYSLPVLQIPLYGKMNKFQLSISIMEELNSNWDYYNPDDDKEIEQLYNDYCIELNNDGGAIFWKGDPDYNEEDDNDYYEPVYAYFSIIEPVWSNGIMFLNK